MLVHRSEVVASLGLTLFCLGATKAQERFGVVQGMLAGEKRDSTAEMFRRSSNNNNKVALALAIPISINGSPTTWWFVDTGAPASLIKPAFAQKLSLRTDGEIKTTAGDTSPQKSLPIVTINEMQVGTFHCNRVRCLVRPIGELEDMAFRFWHGSFDKTGLIGVNVLGPYGALINCRTQQIFFSPTGNLGMSRSKYEEKGYTYIPMNVTTNGRLEVVATIGSEPFSFFIDTGSFTTLLDSWTRNATKTPFWGTVGTLAGPFHDFKGSTISYATMQDFRFGSYNAAGANIGFADLHLSGADSSSRFAGLIGMDFLFLRSAIIDIGGRALYLKPSSRVR
jgi:hypothetical protein